MTTKKNKLLILDGNALIHRSFHALPPSIQTKKGEITNAVYGFSSVLLKALKEFKPKYVVLTLDKKGPTFRHEKFAEYKAKRVKAPNELYQQIPRVKQIATAFAIPIFEQSGYEADDLIGTVARQIESQTKDVESIIVTGDMDTLQLINDRTKVYTMSRGLSDSCLYDKEAVYKKYKLTVEQIVDYKALRGDPSDNIPGVKGVGEKTAVELLQAFSSLDKIYEAIAVTDKKLNSFKPRIIELLKEYKKDAYLSRELALIDTKAPIDFRLEKTVFGDFDSQAIIGLLSELEFKSLLPRIKEIKEQKKISSSDSKQQALDKFSRNKNDFTYELIDSETKFEKFFEQLKQQKVFTFDTETSGFDPLQSDLLGISFSWQSGQAFYLDCRQTKNLSQKNQQNSLFAYQEKEEDNISFELKKLKTIFANSEIKKIAHNAKFDLRVLQAQGLDVFGIDFDTMLASYLLNPGTRQHSLDSLTFIEFGFEKISKDDLLGKGREKISFVQVETEKLSLYSCEDADFTNRLADKLTPKLEKAGLKKLFQDIEMPLVPVLAKMENNGILVNGDFLDKMNKKLKKEIKKLAEKIHALADCVFNINSTVQLKEILFEKLALPSELVKKTKTGFSTASEELEKLKSYHEIIPYLIEYRELNKLVNTYAEALPKLINPNTKRVHTSFNQTITATGRLSSTEPNLQNIPVKTELGREIRKAFVAATGCKLLAMDYSQIELRLAAHLSADEKLIEAFQKNLDIHLATAAQINEIDLNQVSSEMRQEAKAVNFGILYGQGPHGLSQNTGLPYAKAKEFIDKYFLTFVGVKDYIEKSIKQAKEEGYVETLFGRRRFLPEINSSIPLVRKSAERMAVNTPLQGSSADIIKIAMIKIHEKIKNNPDIKLLLQVHDELIFEVKESEVEKFSLWAKEIMENIITLKIPIIVNCKIGANWGELNEIK